MTRDTFSIVYVTLQQCWRFFWEWSIPGTNVSPGAWALFIMAGVLGIRVIQYVLSLVISPKGSGGK